MTSALYRASRAVLKEAGAAGLTIHERGISAEEVLNLDDLGPATRLWKQRIIDLHAEASNVLDRAGSDSYKPTAAMRSEAARGLEWRQQHGRGGTEVGVARARDIAGGRSLSIETVQRMVSYFARHEVDKKGTGWSPGEDGYPSAGRIAWALWGGDPGKGWAEGIVNRLDRQALPNEVPEMADMTDPIEVAPVLYGLDTDVLKDKVGAVDAAIDAAQSLLEAIEDDPRVQQAYWLLVAADSALDDVMEACGLTDADDEMNEGEDPAAEPTGSEEMAARAAIVDAAEKRTFVAELRATEGTRIAGYAAKFNTEASGLPFREEIAPGAFARSLQSGEPVFLLVNHDTDMVPLASTQGGTLALREDGIGLFMEAELDPMNPRAAELLSALKRGDVDKMSFAFTVAPNGQRKVDGLRTLTDLNLHEVSVVTWPAYSDTTVGMRSADDEALAQRRRLLALKFAHAAHTAA